MVKLNPELQELKQKELEKHFIQQVYIEVCKKHDFSLHWEDAAFLTAEILNIFPLEVGLAFPKTLDLNQIALGLHPDAINPRIQR